MRIPAALALVLAAAVALLQCALPVGADQVRTPSTPCAREQLTLAAQSVRLCRAQCTARAHARARAGGIVSMLTTLDR